MEEDNKQLYTIILRHDTSTQWAINNPILTLGEYAVEDDTHRVKRGDGETEWNDLPYEEFGLVYLVTYKNLSGEVKDNKALQDALDEKLFIDVFKDVQYQTVSSINFESADGNGAIGKITRITKDVNNGTTNDSMILIKSPDNSIQGYWTADEGVLRTLNLVAESSITDYEVGHKYYRDQLCYFKNILYRAVTDFEAEQAFNPDQWTKLASLYSSDIKYDNLSSGLDSETVKDAIDELKRRDDRKVVKSSEERIVYGTNANGEQTVIPIDDLRKVDTVNHQKADINKNVQLDASQINYNDAMPELGTVQDVVFSKVDKNVAGVGAKIVRDISVDYDEVTGHITLIEDKISLEDGSNSKERREIDVVAEKELADTKKEINDKIIEEHNTFTKAIADVANDLLDTIDTTKKELKQNIDENYETLDNKIDENYNTLDTKIDTETDRLDTRITTSHNELVQGMATLGNELSEKIDNTKKELKANIDENYNTLDNKIDTTKTELKTNIDENYDTLDKRITTEKNSVLQALVEVSNDLTNTIEENDRNINARVDEEVETLNETIDTNKADIEQKLSDGLDLKIDKDIADNIITDIIASTETLEPTLKIVRHNTHSKKAIVHHLHFSANGDIETKFVDDDHIQIDSSLIDAKINKLDERATRAEERLDVNDKNISSLQEHDVNHDKLIALQAEKLAQAETTILEHTDKLQEHTDKILALETTDADQEAHLTRHDQELADHNNRINQNASSIVETNQNVARNTREITTLQGTKANKTFASKTNNNVVGNLELVQPDGTEVVNFKGTYVNPSTEKTSTFNLKITSSDQTIVAKQLGDGTIDIATNLDTDVNYFITSETLNTSIAYSNTLQLDSLTPSDKVEVEIHDIITDAEGTWARVQTIDKEARTCTALTFHKHAQAVWGTVKGNIEDQSDLVDKFNTLKSELGADLQSAKAELEQADAEESTLREQKDTELESAINTNKTEIEQRVSLLEGKVTENKADIEGKLGQAQQELNETINTTKSDLQQADTDLDNKKLDKVETPEIIYGTDEAGNQKSYTKDDLSKVDTVNSVVPDENKNIKVTGADTEIGLNGANIPTDKNIALILATLKSNMEAMTEALANQIVTYQTGIAYAPISVTLTKIEDDTTEELQRDKFVTFTREDGILLMAKVLKPFTADNSQPSDYECFMYDVEQENLKLIGIPEQTPNV